MRNRLTASFHVSFTNITKSVHYKMATSGIPDVIIQLDDIVPKTTSYEHLDKYEANSSKATFSHHSATVFPVEGTISFKKWINAV